ncbi:MAG: NAD(P)-dependent oxidoreductase [Geminicoccaceae bacterium]|nr:NAD(P)-dependent oxidoreductase [Geminicoccaceae bacterium]
MSGLPRLGFLGIGIMGKEMVLRLLERGFPVTVWNLEPERLPLVTAHGAVAAESPAAVARSCDILCQCVLHAAAVERCCFAEDGVATVPGQDRLVIDFSTVNPDDTRRIAGRLAEEAGWRWLDAPVSGGPGPAREGRLTIMAGGDAADLERARPVLEALAANLTHMGPLGMGQTAKIANQAIVGVGYLLMAEVLALVERAGLDASLLPKALAGGMADSTVLQRIFPQQQKRDFDPPRSYARQLDKDLQNVRRFLTAMGLELPLVALAVERYHGFAQAHPMADSASVARLYEAAAGPTRSSAGGDA